MKTKIALLAIALTAAVGTTIAATDACALQGSHAGHQGCAMNTGCTTRTVVTTAPSGKGVTLSRKMECPPAAAGCCAMGGMTHHEGMGCGMAAMSCCAK